MVRFVLISLVVLTSLFSVAPALRATDRMNILFVLTDDHRYDAMGFMASRPGGGGGFIETPHMDRLAREGVHCANAFVTTSLCSPSRASILTGLYAHTHGVVDNYHPVREDLVFFPQYLQQAGYETAFIGKWHMGETDEPQRGFDHWVAFKGQGTYWPDGRGTTREVPQTSYEGFNVNGRRVPQKGYITDEVTDYAIDWIKARDDERPWFCYVSHKAVHSDFVAADRHKGRYADKKLKRPPTFADTPENYRNKPMWLKNQRNSRHGVDFAYNLDDFDLDEYVRRYMETLLAVDDNLGRLLKTLEESGQLDNTLVVYMGDNGFQLGEHGLIDKRTAYEASIRVPLIMRGPGLPKSKKLEQVVANIDVAPTLLEAAGVKPPAAMQGRSFMPLLREDSDAAAKWPSELLYEYYWEVNYPQTPTTHAIRTDRYKYIRYHGVWDINELYDLKNDPHEQHNLIFDPAHAERVKQLNARLFELLAASGGEAMPLMPDRGTIFPLRHPDRAKQAEFPPQFIRPDTTP